MHNYSNPKKLREKSLTLGLGWADEQLQKEMAESAYNKALASMENLENSNNFATTDWGNYWIADNLKFLAENLIQDPPSGVVKAYIDFPKKYNHKGETVSSYEYLKNATEWRAKGLKTVEIKDGAEYSRDQVKINEFVIGSYSARNRAMTVAFIMLSELLSYAFGNSNKTSVLDVSENRTLKTLTGVCGHIMNNVLTQLIIGKAKDLRAVMDVPSLSKVKNTKPFTTKKGTLNVKGKKFLEIMNLERLDALSTEKILQEGYKLLNIADGCIDDIEIDHVKRSIDLSDKCKASLDNSRTRTLTSAKECRPVLQKPLTCGRYTSYNEFPLKSRLIQNEVDYEATRVSDLDREALNRIQGTAFNINKNILRVAKELIDKGIRIGDKICLDIPSDLPPLEDLPRKAQFKTSKEYLEAREAWMQTGDLVENPNKEATNKMIPGNMFRKIKWNENRDARIKKQQKANSVNDMNRSTLEIAQWYADWGGAFYLPCFMDYRTRVYYCPTVLNPQASKLAKALFISAKHEAIGSKEALDYWLANLGGSMDTVVSPDGVEYGGDKSPWNVCLYAAQQELPKAVQVAEDPIKHIKHWSTQDEPWTYLGHCFEAQEVLEKGTEAVSRIFINMDGSCNSNQHCSAYLLDRKTATLVNMVFTSDDEKPSDMYGAVADHYRAKFDMENMIHKYFSAKNFVNRGTCKKITMTMGYGLTKGGARNNARAEIETLTDDYNNNPFDNCGREESVEEFAMGVWDSIAEVAPSVMMAKEACQEIGKLIARYDQTGIVEWTSFTGTKCSFTKYQQETKRVSKPARIGAKRSSFAMKTTSDKIDESNLSNAMPPNMTHCNDASHLRMTVMAMPEEAPLLVIHDSDGTTARYSPQLAKAIRTSWVDLYNDRQPLREFADETLGRVYKDFNIDKKKVWDLEYLEEGLSAAQEHKNKERVRLFKGLIKIRTNSIQTGDYDISEVMGARNFFR